MSFSFLVAVLERPYLASLNPGLSFSASPGEAVSSFPEPRFFLVPVLERQYLASLNPGMSLVPAPGEAVSSFPEPRYVF